MMCMLLTLVMIVSLVPLAVTAEDIPETYTVQFNLNTAVRQKSQIKPWLLASVSQSRKM